jgi:hypothetical protein
MADVDDYEYVSDGSYEFADGCDSDSSDCSGSSSRDGERVSRRITTAAATKLHEPIDSQVVSAINATTATVLGDCMSASADDKDKDNKDKDTIHFSWCFAAEPTLYFTVGTIRGHLVFASVTANSYKNAKVVFSETHSAIHQVAFGSLLGRILKVGEANNTEDAAVILRDAFHIMHTESVGVTDSNKVQFAGPDADVQTFLKTLAPMIPPSRSFSNGIARLLHLIVYTYKKLAQHCYICGRVHEQVRPDRKPRVCSNELCRFVLQTSPAVCDLYTAVRDPHAAFCFDFAHAMLTAAAKIPGRAEALLTPVHQEFVLPGGKIDVAKLSATLSSLAAFDISVARDMETNREIIEYCKTLNAGTVPACLVYWIMNIVTDRCTIKGVDKTREECERNALVLQWHDSKEHTAAYMAHAASLPSADVLSAYHGSRLEHWYSILQHGLIMLSGTRHMTSGAAYGNGIYMSSNFQTSWGYCADYGYSTSGSKRFTCMARSNILSKSPHLSTTGHYVINNTAAFQTQELLVFMS